MVPVMVEIGSVVDDILLMAETEEALNKILLLETITQVWTIHHSEEKRKNLITQRNITETQEINF